MDAMEAIANIQVPGESLLTITMTCTVDEWATMRDQIQLVQNGSVPLAEMALKLDAIIQKAQARL